MKRIYNIWISIQYPKAKGNFVLKRYEKTNLYIAKTIDNNFGFFIADIPNKLTKNYENLEIEKYAELKTDNNTICDVLSVIAKNSIDSNEFAKTFDACFEDFKEKKLFNIDDVKDILKKISEFTKYTPNPNYEEVVGLWGELYLINKFLQNISSNTDAFEIIRSWEGPHGKTVIDFNIKQKRTQIEVKTTAKQQKRVHHFFSINQVTCQNGYDAGFLATLKINEDKSYGQTCYDLVSKIKTSSYFDKNLITLFNEKLEFKGEKYFNNTKLAFVLSDLSFCDFNKVPQPRLDKYVLDASWDSDLTEIEDVFLNKEQRKELIKIFKSIS